MPAVRSIFQFSFEKKKKNIPLECTLHSMDEQQRIEKSGVSNLSKGVFQKFICYTLLETFRAEDYKKICITFASVK